MFNTAEYEDKGRTPLTERAGIWSLWGGGAKKGRVFWLSEKDGSLDTTHL